MTTLVTGATSGLGLNAVAFLRRRGDSVRAVGRNQAVAPLLSQLGAEFCAADLSSATSQDTERLFNGVSTVWHCAALSSPWGAYEDFYQANVVVTDKLSDWAGARGVKVFVHISTPSLYFDYRAHRDIPESYRPSRFVNAYAQTKAMAEDVIQEAARRYPNTRFVLLRPRALFGPHDRVVLPRILGLLEKRRGVLPLPAGGRALVDLTYVENVIHAMNLATEASHLPSGAVFNVTNQEPNTLAYVLDRLLRQELGIEVHIKDVPYPVLDVAARGLEVLGNLSGKEPPFTRYSIGALNFDMTLSSTKARQELGYTPLYSLDEGISRTAKWLKTHGRNSHI